MTLLDPTLWATVQASLPIVCVDVVLARRDEVGKVTQVGFIRRLNAEENATTWCHIGGRMQLGESIADAILQHVSETVQIDVSKQLGSDPQPDYIQQYFTSPDTRPGLPLSGVDTRKRPVAFSYLVAVDEMVKAVPGSEGLEFAWFNVEQLRALSDTWPGTMEMVSRVLEQTEN